MVLIWHTLMLTTFKALHLMNILSIPVKAKHNLTLTSLNTLQYVWLLYTYLIILYFKSSWLLEILADSNAIRIVQQHFLLLFLLITFWLMSKENSNSESNPFWLWKKPLCPCHWLSAFSASSFAHLTAAQLCWNK